MYVRTLDGLGLRLGEPPAPAKVQQPEFQKQFISNVIAYKDTKGNCQSTKYAIYVPPALRNPKEIDLVLFFHGLLNICDSAHKFDPENVIKKFQMNIQVYGDSQLALAVPIVWWNSEDRNLGVIRAAWSAAYLNAFVEEVLDQIGKAYGVRPKLGQLFLVGHSAAYDILTPLAEQFDCGAAETKKGALAKLKKVVAMDITYGTSVAKALDQWARNLPDVQFNVVLSKKDPSVPVWLNWEEQRKKMGQKRPANMRVFHHTEYLHCQIPSTFLVTYLRS